MYDFCGQAIGAKQHVKYVSGFPTRNPTNMSSLHTWPRLQQVPGFIVRTFFSCEEIISIYIYKDLQ